MRTDRRVYLFLAAAGACFALTRIAPSDARSLATGLGVVYVMLALVVLLDWIGRNRRS